MVHRVRPLAEVDRAVVQKVLEQRDALCPEPNRQRQRKRHARRVAQQIELVELLGWATHAFGLDLGRFVEQLLGKDVLRHKDERRQERLQDAEQLAPVVGLAGAGQHDAHGQGDQGEVRVCWVSDVVDQSVRQHGKQRRQALDRVDKRHGDLGRRSRAEQMAANLEDGQGQRRHDDFATGLADRVSQRRDLGAQDGEHTRQPGEEDAERGHKGKLDQRQRRRHVKGIEDGL